MHAPSLTRLATASALALLSSLAQAQVTLDQNKALAGSVTGGDSAGFPITISQSGSYKLTGNLVVPAGTKGIVVTAANVTIDLNGFSLVGPSTCTRDGSTRQVACTYTDNLSHGIDASAATGTAVRNGTVKGFAGYGISFGGMARLDNLRVTENAGGVIDSVGAGLFISDSTVDQNGSIGILAARGIVSRCRVARNGSHGLSGTPSLVVTESAAASNRLFGASEVAVRGTLLDSNGNNRSAGVVSMGGNLDGTAPF